VLELGNEVVNGGKCVFFLLHTYTPCSLFQEGEGRGGEGGIVAVFLVTNGIQNYILAIMDPLANSTVEPAFLDHFGGRKYEDFAENPLPLYFNVHEFTMLVRLWSYFPTNPRLSN
jgi:hypothetical protein